jgi:hypothetical protein
MPQKREPSSTPPSNKGRNWLRGQEVREEGIEEREGRGEKRRKLVASESDEEVVAVGSASARRRYEVGAQGKVEVKGEATDGDRKVVVEAIGVEVGVGMEEKEDRDKDQVLVETTGICYAGGKKGKDESLGFVGKSSLEVAYEIAKRDVDKEELMKKGMEMKVGCANVEASRERNAAAVAVGAVVENEIDHGNVTTTTSGDFEIDSNDADSLRRKVLESIALGQSRGEVGMTTDWEELKRRLRCSFTEHGDAVLLRVRKQLREAGRLCPI